MRGASIRRVTDRSIARLLAVGLACVLLAGCNAATSPSPGAPSPSTSAPVAASATASPSAAASASESMSAAASASVVASASASAVAQFAVSSPRILSGGRIPVEFTCDGGQMSPPLEWTGVPTGTVALALIVDDPDANGFVHWVAYGIEPGANLAQGISRAPGAPREGLNSRGTVGWTGPCPPSGTHHYDFTLYALTRAVSFDQRPTAAQLRAAMNGAIIATSRLVATYRRG